MIVKWRKPVGGITRNFENIIAFGFFEFIGGDIIYVELHASW